MRAKFIRNQDSKKSMEVGSYRPMNNDFKPEPLYDYSDEFKKKYNLPIGTRGIFAGWHETNNELHGDGDEITSMTKWDEILLNEFAIRYMDQNGLLDEFSEGLINILEEANTKYEWDPFSVPKKLKFNIRTVER